MQVMRCGGLQREGTDGMRERELQRRTRTFMQKENRGGRRKELL